MRHLAPLVLAGLALALAASPSRGDCLTDGHTVVVPTINRSAANVLPGGADTAYDFTSVGRLDETPPQYPVQTTGTGDVCFHGLVVGGNASTNIPWDKYKSSYDGVAAKITMAGNAAVIFENISLFRVMDGLRPAGGGADASVSFDIHNIFATEVHDDFIENDECEQGSISNVLVLYSFNFYSNRPGSKSVPPHTCPTNSLVVTMNNVLFETGCLAFHHVDGDSHPNNGDCPIPSPGDPHNTYTAQRGGNETIIKVGGRPVKIHMSNSMFYIKNISVNGTGAMGIPTAAGNTYSNNTIVCPASVCPGGVYPDTLPSSGFTVTNDVSVWTNRKNAWLAANGCSETTHTCTWTTVVDPPPPDVGTVTSSPTSVDWTATEPADFAGYQVRTSPVAGTAWGAMTPLTAPWSPSGLDPAKTLDRALLPVGTIRVAVKEQDDAGQVSPNAAAIDFPCACGCFAASVQRLPARQRQGVIEAFGCHGAALPFPLPPGPASSPASPAPRGEPIRP